MTPMTCRVSNCRDKKKNDFFWWKETYFPCLYRKRRTRERRRTRETREMNGKKYRYWIGLHKSKKRERTSTLDKKKEPSPRFAVRRTLFDLVITSDQRRARSSATLALRWSRVRWSSMISDDGTAFFSPRISEMVLFFFLSRVVLHLKVNTKVFTFSLSPSLHLSFSLHLSQSISFSLPPSLLILPWPKKNGHLDYA